MNKTQFDNSTNDQKSIMPSPDTLIVFIEQELLPPNCGIKLEATDDLLSIGYLDSMQFMRLVQFSEETYDIKIPPEDLLIEHFQTVDNLTQYLCSRIETQ